MSSDTKSITVKHTQGLFSTAYFFTAFQELIVYLIVVLIIIVSHICSFVPSCFVVNLHSDWKPEARFMIHGSLIQAGRLCDD